jgi:hypothetical protein
LRADRLDESVKETIMRLISLFVVTVYLSLSFASEKKNWVIEDTMITNDNEGLFKIPNSRNPKDEFAVLKPNTVVYVVDKNPTPNELEHNAIDYFLKVKTPAGQTGYIWIAALNSKKQFNQHQDSLKLWAQSPLPSYKTLIGTTYFKNSELPVELFSGEFVSTGEKSLYGIISVSNKYNGNYSYLFFVIEDKANGDGLKILDIVPLNARTFKKGSSLWFKQCECLKKSTDCSDVVAIYHHSEEMAKKNIMVKPDKAWRPNYATKKLEAIPPESVKCGSMAPEEDDANGP